MSSEPTESQDSIGLDRILFFSDAVVAIAITLLALPLVDAAVAAHSATRFFAEDNFDLVAAAISFFMIASSWRANHRLFRGVTGYTELVVTIDFVWLASIIALPIATALIVLGSSTDRLTLTVYLGVVTIAAGLTRIQREVLARSGLLRHPERTRGEVVYEWLPVASRLVATILSAIVPSIGLWSLLTLFPVTVYSLVTRRPRPHG